MEEAGAWTVSQDDWGLEGPWLQARSLTVTFTTNHGPTPHSLKSLLTEMNYLYKAVNYEIDKYADGLLLPFGSFIIILHIQCQCMFYLQYVLYPSE
ncbi:hypothetical protein BS47DRAFT_885545 [Hydnum rufescens UP504]|uniref:Uncharacterized protein n=1 Tax=Hydnum rufescens UP504 TaxID=1448309 RepID=A0A9P6AYT2_9AGAM|nr:hypothetical protein BS47DRAFT_885545 [Hydnum rufescens UP504]